MLEELDEALRNETHRDALVAAVQELDADLAKLLRSAPLSCTGRVPAW